MTLKQKKRIQFFLRDNGRCVHCGLLVSLATMRVERGRTACRLCEEKNLEKKA